MLPSVAGTPPAQEAVIDNSIPETAEVNRATTRLTTTYGGSPQLQDIEGTPLQYVANSQYPVIRVDGSTWYALKDAVWFEGTSVNGPWAVADSVPDVIYTIPPSSPLHYVTYASVYGATPQTVTVGYTPGYYGTVLAPTGVVVYGTGYVYPPVYAGSLWYPPLATYGGFGTGFFWGSVTGFAFGAAAGALWGGAWGHWGGYGGDNNVTINNNNSYNHWNSNQVRTNAARNYQHLTPEQRQQAQRDYDRRTRQLTPEQRSNLEHRASTRPNDTFAGRDGNAYRRGSDGGWQRHGSSGWTKADFGGGRESADSLDRQQQARSYGNWADNVHRAWGGGGGDGSRLGGLGGWHGGFDSFHGFGGGGFGGGRFGGGGFGGGRFGGEASAASEVVGAFGGSRGVEARRRRQPRGGPSIGSVAPNRFPELRVAHLLLEPPRVRVPRSDGDQRRGVLARGLAASPPSLLIVASATRTSRSPGWRSWAARRTSRARAVWPVECSATPST